MGAPLIAITPWITVLSYLTWRSRRLGDLIDGVPLVIVQDGRPIERTLKLERLPIDEVLETTGRISFITAGGAGDDGDDAGRSRPGV